jgi:hypothetical protein
LLLSFVVVIVVVVVDAPALFAIVNPSNKLTSWLTPFVVKSPHVVGSSCVVAPALGAIVRF